MYPNLKLQIWKSGIRQNQLARMLQMDETMLSRIVNGYRNPKAELRESIAKLLCCDVAWLFEELESVHGSSAGVVADTRTRSKSQKAS